MKHRTKERGPLPEAEVKRGTLFLIKYHVEMRAFSREIKTLSDKIRIKEFSISSLSPFSDVDGIIWVGYRLINYDLQIDVSTLFCFLRASTVSERFVFSFKKLSCFSPNFTILCSPRILAFEGKCCCYKIVHSCVQCFKDNRKK